MGLGLCVTLVHGKKDTYERLGIELTVLYQKRGIEQNTSNIITITQIE